MWIQICICFLGLYRFVYIMHALEICKPIYILHIYIYMYIYIYILVFILISIFFCIYTEIWLRFFLLFYICRYVHALVSLAGCLPKILGGWVLKVQVAWIMQSFWTNIVIDEYMNRRRMTVRLTHIYFYTYRFACICICITYTCTVYVKHRFTYQFMWIRICMLHQSFRNKLSVKGFRMDFRWVKPLSSLARWEKPTGAEKVLGCPRNLVNG